MIDCGEGTQMQLRRSKIRFTKLRAVFISHLHGDHCFGLIGMISTFGMLGRTAPLHVYAPEAFEPILQEQLDFFCKGLEFKVEFHAVDTLKNDVIYEDQSLTIETIPLEHRIPTCGFLFREKPRPRHINRKMTDCYEVPLCQLNNIRNGMDWTTPEGIVIANERLPAPQELMRIAVIRVISLRSMSLWLALIRFIMKALMRKTIYPVPDYIGIRQHVRQQPWLATLTSGNYCWDISVHAMKMKHAFLMRQSKYSKIVG